MADAITIKALQDASLDAKSLEEVVNGNEAKQVTTRKGETYPSVKKAIKTMFENGGLPATPFKTKSELDIATPTLNNGDLAYVLLDDELLNNGIYIKDGGVMKKSAHDTEKALRGLIDDEIYDKRPLTGTHYVGSLYVGASGVSIDHSVSKYKTSVFHLEKNTEYRIDIGSNKSRFRIGLHKGGLDIDEIIAQGGSGVVELGGSLVFDDVSASTFSFNSQDNTSLFIYVGDRAVTDTPKVTTIPYMTKKPIVASGLLNPIEGKDIALKTIDESRVSFIDKKVVDIDTPIYPSYGLIYNTEADSVYYGENRGGPNFRASVGLKKGSRYTVRAIGNSGNRFRIAVFATRPTVNMVADQVVSTNDSLKEITFVNEIEDGVLHITLSNRGDDVGVSVTEESLSIAGLIVPNTTEFIQEPKYSIEYGKVVDNTVNTIKNGSDAPRLASIKYEYKDSQFPEPVAYLYTTNEPPYKLLYSSGRIDDLKNLAEWDASKTHTGNLTPSHYTAYITQQGDIIFVYRGDLTGGNLNPEARQNPIIYPADDYSAPYVVDFGDSVKPTGWARCNGIAPIFDGDGFLFNEYTRPAHEKMYIWKVTRPFNNPDNWRKVYELTVDRPEEGAVRLKHFHALNYDPWSGAYLASCGDLGSGARIFMSKDVGETWPTQAAGSESLCRLSQFSFDADAVYWGSDSHRDKHLLIKASRDDDGYPILDIEGLEVLHTFKNNADSNIATYNTVRLRSPNGLLFLDRDDSSLGDKVNLNFWSLDEEKMIEFDFIHRLKGSTDNIGFRCDAVALYQPYTDNRIIVGFNSNFARNNMDIAGNSMSSKLGNLTINISY